MRRVAGALVNIRVRSSRSGLSGINRPVENLKRNPRQANKLLSQQNLPTGDIRHDRFRMVYFGLRINWLAAVVME